MAQPLPLFSPATGCFMSGETAVVTRDARSAGVPYVYLATNMRIEDRRLKTRHKWKQLKCLGAPEGWDKTDTQGAVWHDPPGAEPGAIVESASGKLYRINLNGRTFTVDDISSGKQAAASLRIAWLASGENYVIRTDGSSPTQIFDGQQTTISIGYNSNSPDNSGLPNGAGPVAFTDRFWIVNGERDIIAGDVVHFTTAVDNSDLIRTRAQGYDVNNVSFPPPAAMGAVKALHVLTTTRGGGVPAQSEIVASTVNPGMWGVLGGLPRSQWSSAQMRRIVMDNTGPAGPYAAVSGVSEILFRSPGGIQSIKYADQEKALPGNPMVNIGQEIKPLLDNDFPDDLLFASAVSEYSRSRFACTVWPQVSSAARWHRGYVSASMQPGRTRVPENMVWEGVGTLPAEMGEIVQFVQCETKIMAILRQKNGIKTLAEWTTEDGDDELADGRRIPIPWQICTRRLIAMSDYSATPWKTVFLRVEQIRARATAELFALGAGRREMEPIFRREFCNGDWATCGFADSGPLPVTKLQQFSKSPWIQFLVKGKGSCTVDLAIGDTAAENPVETLPPEQSLTGRCCLFDPFLRG